MNLKAWALAASLAWLPFGAGASDDVCTFNAGASNWGPIATVTGAGVVCAGGGAAISNDDSFVVPDGATVTVIEDITFVNPGADPDKGIRVEAGGTLIVDNVADADTPLDALTITSGEPDAALDLTVATAYFTCEGTCTFQGGYLEFGVTAPSWLNSPATTAGDFATAGDIIPGDFGLADATMLRINYPTADYDSVAAGDIGETFWEEYIDLIVAGTDYLCWFQPNLDDDPGFDVNACYQVDATEGDPAVGMYIDIDIRQGPDGNVADSYTDAMRDTECGTLATSLTVGDTFVDLGIGGIGAGFDNVYVGRFLRLEKDSVMQQISYPIYQSEENGGAADHVRLAIPVKSDHATGDATENEWCIDYGPKRGDPFFIVRPVDPFVTYTTDTLHAANFWLAHLASPDLEMDGVLIHDGGPISVDAGTVINQWYGVIIEDQTSDNGELGSVLHMQAITAALGGPTATVPLGLTSVAGEGDVAAANGGHRVLVCPVAPSGVLNFQDWVIRHGGDDFFATCSQAARAISQTINVDRYRGQFGDWTAGGSSGNCITHNLGGLAFSTEGVRINATNVLCANADSGLTGNLTFNFNGVCNDDTTACVGDAGCVDGSSCYPGKIVVDNFVNLGPVASCGGIGTVRQAVNRYTLKNGVCIGARGDNAAAGQAVFGAADIDRVVFRDNSSAAGANSVISPTGIARTWVKNSIIARNEVSITGQTLGVVGVLETDAGVNYVPSTAGLTIEDQGHVWENNIFLDNYTSAVPGANGFYIDETANGQCQGGDAAARVLTFVRNTMVSSPDVPAGGGAIDVYHHVRTSTVEGICEYTRIGGNAYHTNNTGGTTWIVRHDSAGANDGRLDLTLPSFCLHKNLTDFQAGDEDHAEYNDVQRDNSLGFVDPDNNWMTRTGGLMDTKMCGAKAGTEAPGLLRATWPMRTLGMTVDEAHGSGLHREPNTGGGGGDIHPKNY